MTPSEFIDNPAWADFIPERNDTVCRQHLPTHEDCSPLDVDGARLHLRRGGTLGSMPGYEERPGQLDMLAAIARAFNAREHLMIEAGTGVGKSLAYLIPSILWAHLNDTPVVISTATRNLQSQLLQSDIPRALAVLGDDAAGFRVALLKGRSNYLCLRAVGDYFAAGYWSMPEEERAELPHFIEWLQSTVDGDLDRYDGLPRSMLNCPGEECGGRRCPWYSRCFVYRARRNAAEAHLVVVNHALVLAESGTGGGGLLPPHGRVVFDEAHNLEDIATDALSREFSLPALMRLLSRLTRRGHSRNARPCGILAAVERQWQKGILSQCQTADVIKRLLDEASSRVVRVTAAADALADYAEHLLRPAVNREMVRYAMIEGCRRHSLNGLFACYEPDDWSEAECLDFQARFEHELALLVNLLHDLRDAINDSVPPGEMNYCSDLSIQLDGLAASFVEFANDANFVLHGEDSSHAYWIERMHPQRRPAYLRLVAAPLSVAEELRRRVWNLKDSAILSSATLRVGNDFKYMARRLGFCPSEENPQESRYRYLTAASPFDYFRQSLVLAPDCLPDPSSDPAGYAHDLAGLLAGLLRKTNGRALVLFTSYEMMNAVADASREGFAAAGLTLLVQGEGLSRESMTMVLRESRSDSRAVVLFGAQSFWEGVDVAGEALSCVVLARLPFAQRADPIVEARSEMINRKTSNRAFHDYYLPEAVIRFRQGFGRLIRTRRDRGVVVITDPRIVTKTYGSVFRQSIPASVHTVTSVEELVSRVEDFFS